MVPKQTVWGLFTHFVYDIFHFDGKFFHTLKHLLFRPGYIPRAYIAGKRMSYLDPIRMYLFTSAIFFLVFFSITKAGESFADITGDTRSMTKMERLEYASTIHQQLAAGNTDTLLKRQLNFLLDTNYRVVLTEPDEKPDNDSNFLIRLGESQYLMEVARRKGEDIQINSNSAWLSERLKIKWWEYKKKFGDDDRAMISSIIDSFVHKFPYILFVSLPFFALILKLLYVRRKYFYYTDHAVFTLYHYIFTFILLLFFFLINAINKNLEWGFLSLLANLIFLSGGVYLLIAMKRFYGQRWVKTLGKFLLLNVLALFTMSMLMVAFILLSVFQL